MTLTQRLKNMGNTTASYAISTTAAAGVLFTGCMLLDMVTYPLRSIASIPAHFAVSGLQAGAEALQGDSVEQYRGTVKAIGYSHLMQTHGVIYWADMALLNGETMRVHDAARVLEGKRTANTIIPTRKDLEECLAWFQSTNDLIGVSSNQKGLTPGKTYTFSVIGSNTLGHTILDATEVEGK